MNIKLFTAIGNRFPFNLLKSVPISKPTQEDIKVLNMVIDLSAIALIIQCNDRGLSVDENAFRILVAESRTSSAEAGRMVDYLYAGNGESYRQLKNEVERINKAHEVSLNKFFLRGSSNDKDKKCYRGQVYKRAIEFTSDGVAQKAIEIHRRNKVSATKSNILDALCL